MALTYPLSVAQFQDVLQITNVRMFPDQPRDSNRTAGGAIVSASLGDAVWRGSFSIAPTNDYARAARQDALLSVVDRPGASFLIHHPYQTHPAADPDGSILGAATPTISGIDVTDARIMGLSNLPAGYVLTAGDLIGWQYGTNPVRYALHRVVETKTAGAGGGIPLLEVTPFIEQASLSGVAVQLIKPVLKAKLVPSPDYGEVVPAIARGAQFAFVQTVR
jgi:hypothetical protein